MAGHQAAAHTRHPSGTAAAPGQRGPGGPGQPPNPQWIGGTRRPPAPPPPPPARPHMHTHLAAASCHDVEGVFLKEQRHIWAQDLPPSRQDVVLVAGGRAVAGACHIRQRAGVRVHLAPAPGLVEHCATATCNHQLHLPWPEAAELRNEWPHLLRPCPSPSGGLLSPGEETLPTAWNPEMRDVAMWKQVVRSAQLKHTSPTGAEREPQVHSGVNINVQNVRRD